MSDLYVEDGFWEAGYAEGDGLGVGAGTRRGDDGGHIRHTGEALAAIYQKQIEEFAEEVKGAPRPKAKAKKIAALEKKLAAIEDVVNEPRLVEEVDYIGALLSRLKREEIGYPEFETAALAQLEIIETIKIEQRRVRHRRIAMAMLFSL